MRDDRKLFPALLSVISSAVAGLGQPLGAQATGAVTLTTPTGVLSGTSLTADEYGPSCRVTRPSALW